MLCYRERLILPVGLQKDAGNVRVGTPLQRALGKPSKLADLKRQFQNEKFLLNVGEHSTDMVLHQKATGEDAVKGWLLAANLAKYSNQIERDNLSTAVVYGPVLEKAYEETERHLPEFLAGLRAHGWHTHLFLEGSGVRAVW